MRFGLSEVSIVAAGVVGVFLVAYPAVRICRRLGLPSALGILSVVPVANLLLLWFVAVARWPNDPHSSGRGVDPI